jgi:hypothetical protein
MSEKYWKYIKVDNSLEERYKLGKKYKEVRYIEGWTVDDKEQLLIELAYDDKNGNTVEDGGCIFKTQSDWSYDDLKEYMSEHFEKMY